MIIDRMTQSNEWQAIDTLEPEKAVLLGKYHPDDGGWFWIASGVLSEGVWWCDFVDGEFVNRNFHAPTHWMPLPAPPSASSEPTEGPES